MRDVKAAEKTAVVEKIGPEKPWFTEGEVSALSGVTRDVLREMREGLPADELKKEPGRVWWSAVAIEAHFGPLVWVRDGKPRVELVKVMRLLANPRLVLARRTNGEIIRLRVTPSKVLRPGMEMEAHWLQADLWERQGQQPRR